MKVVFLCGGTGKRMYPLTEDKFLLNFLGKTLLEHQIDMAEKVRLTRFVIVGNLENIGRIEEIVASIPGIEAETAVQEKPLGIANALEAASQFLNDEIIVVNPNDVFDVSAYSKLLTATEAGSAVSYLFGCELHRYFPGGYLVVDEKDHLRLIVEKPERGKEPSNLINVLIHLHTDPEMLLKYVASVRTDRDDAYEHALGAMAGDGQRIKVLPLPGLWNAIKYPWHILDVVRRFLGQTERYISPSGRVSDKATVEGQVVLDHDVIIMENAVICGPVYIGPHSVIGNNSLVREYSHIGAYCHVGFSTEVKGSYIGDKCWFHMNYVGDSVIGEGCNFGAGTVLANYRFDEGSVSVRVGDETVDTGLVKFGAIIGSNSKTGINASIMPGVKLGPNSIVGPHVCVMQDLAADSMVVAEVPHTTISKQIQMGRLDRGCVMLGGKGCAE